MNETFSTSAKKRVSFAAMKAGQRLWTRNELLLAINLYCILSFEQLH